jgi:hypothetical protein
MTSSKSKLSEIIETWQMWSPRWRFRKIQRGFPWTALILILNFVVGEWPVVFLVDGNGDSLLKLQMGRSPILVFILSFFTKTKLYPNQAFFQKAPILQKKSCSQNDTISFIHLEITKNTCIRHKFCSHASHTSSTILRPAHEN